MLSNTPIKLKAAHTTSAISNNVTDGRNAAMQDTKFSVPLLPLSYFKENLLPPLHDQLDVDVVCDKLWEADAIRTFVINVGKEEVETDRWVLFKDYPSKTLDFKEDRVFQPFAQLADKVAKQALALLYECKVDPEPEQMVKFLCNPTMAPESTNRHNAAKPDSYGVLVERSVDTGDEKAPHWDDVVVPGEFKKRDRDSDFNDNNAKIIWSLHHAMRETVYRRFIFGYTIEDTDMRLWFCSRSDLVVSEKFDFITDHKTLIHFFLSIMFSPMTKLGYDPSISPAERTRDQRTTKYSIKVTCQGREATYITHQVLANISAEAMQGRATRVWRGKQADEKGRPTGHNMVIKDCWIDSDRKREGDILAEILDAAKTSPNPDHLPNIKNHFLTVVHHGDVLVDGVKDTTLSLRRGTEFPEPRQFLDLVRSSATKEVEKPPVGLVTLDKDTVVWLRGFRSDDKSHYRIVFDSEESCDPIDTLTSAHGIWNAMVDAHLGVTTLHQLGFIHRDISAGNVLVGRGIPGRVGAGVGKIVDLEFCKRIDDNNRVHQGRTGTRYFIPLEVQMQEYIFVPDIVAPDHGPSRQKYSLSEISRRRLGKTQTSKIHRRVPNASKGVKLNPASNLETPPFVNNPLHDLESLWWLAVYLILSRLVVEDELSVTVQASEEESTEDEDEEKGQGSTDTSGLPYLPFDQWFTRLLINQAERQVSLGHPTRFLKHAKKGAHKYLAAMVKDLDGARKCLVDAYKMAELNIYTTGVDLTRVKTGDVQEELAGFFMKILQDIVDAGDFEFRPISISFVQPPSALPDKAQGFSLDSAPVLPGMKTRKRALDDSNTDEEQGSGEY
ncbi:hypothetical protein BDY19DRAFT_909100 [Irpex rosettiformis]|uniref:Uncharacterized protein n=1 Tax=Irpex rosettiformis TaxID=378272 RepID=A0ACB8TT98_9APHY|nr:hypothetical protein BDY19DRAFT_909100 [Irpex rosettiformis]